MINIQYLLTVTWLWLRKIYRSENSIYSWSVLFIVFSQSKFLPEMMLELLNLFTKFLLELSTWFLLRCTMQTTLKL